MKRCNFLIPLAAAVLMAMLPAQLLPGDAGISAFAHDRFVVLTAAGVQNVVTTSPNMGANSSNSTQSILWDPAHPQSFYIGGFGFFGRATITGPNSATWAQLSTAGEVTQMSVDASGRVVIMDAGPDQIRLFNPATNVITFVPAQNPWFSDMNAGAVDPATGDYYVGGNGSVWRVRNGVTTGLASGLGAFVTAIKLDPFTSDLIVATSLNSRLLRITQAGIVSDLAPQGAVNRPNSIDFDIQGDFLVGDYIPLASSPFHIYRVPNLGGSPTLVASIPSINTIASSASGISVVGGAPPAYRISVRTYLNGSGSVSLAGIPLATSEGWTGISADTAAPAGTGSFFGITPDSLTIQLALASLVPTAGHPIHWLAGIPGVFPAAPFLLPVGSLSALSGQSWDFLSLALNAGGGVAGVSNAVRVRFP